MDRILRLSPMALGRVAIFALLLPSLGHAGRSRCEIMADSNSFLQEWQINASVAIPPLPGTSYTGGALGIDRGPLIVQLRFNPADLIVESTQVRLRPFLPRDSRLDFLFEMEDDPEFLNLFTGPGGMGLVTRDGIFMPSVVMGELELVYTLNPHMQTVQHSLIIEDVESRRMAGFISIAVHLESNEYRLGYALFREFRGLASDAVRAAIRNIRARGDGRAIVATVKPNNRASIAVLESVGFVRDHQATTTSWRYVYPR